MPLPGPALKRLPALPYRKPTEGRDYWVVDGILPNAEAVVARFRGLEAWELGFPHAQETWPGMRSRDALTPLELAPVEAKVRKLTGTRRLWFESAPDGAYLNHNVVQVVGARESGPRPHSRPGTRNCPFPMCSTASWSTGRIWCTPPGAISATTWPPSG